MREILKTRDVEPSEFPLAAEARAKAPTMVGMLTNAHHDQGAQIGVTFTLSLALSQADVQRITTGMTEETNYTTKNERIIKVAATRPQVREALQEPGVQHAELTVGWAPAPKRVNPFAFDSFER